MNQFIGIGRLTADPDFNVTNSGVSVCKFTLAINRPYQQNGETQTDFLNVVAWRTLADNCDKYLKKGRQCAVTGSVQVRNYNDQNGNKRYVTEIIAEHVEFLGSKDNSANDDYGTPPPAPKKKQVSIAELEEIDDDLLPF